MMNISLNTHIRKSCFISLRNIVTWNFQEEDLYGLEENKPEKTKAELNKGNFGL